MALIRKDVIHVTGRIDGATGRVLSPPPNQFREFTAVRTGVGTYEITMDRAVDETESAVFITVEGAPAAVYTVGRNPGNPDTIITVGTFNDVAPAVPVDRTFSFELLRVGG